MVSLTSEMKKSNFMNKKYPSTPSILFLIIKQFLRKFRYFDIKTNLNTYLQGKGQWAVV